MPDPEFDLVRVSRHEAGAFGVLLQYGLPFAVTLERTFGAEVVIPPGVYECRRTTFYKKGYETYEVIVPDHERVLIHIGNLEEDSEGCILVGLEFGEINGKPGVLLSRIGFLRFMGRTGKRKQVRLRVREVSSA